MYTLIICCLIGQTGDYQPLPAPPPLRYDSTVPPPLPTPYRPPYNSERDWLTNNLIVDHPALEKQIRYKMSGLSDEQVHQLAEYYRQQVAIAQAQLKQMIVQRDSIRAEIENRTRAEERRITEYGSALARQQFEWTLNQYYNPYNSYNYQPNYRPYYHPHYYHPVPHVNVHPVQPYVRRR